MPNTSPIGLSTYQWNNNLKSFLVVATFPLLLIGLVALFFTFSAYALADPTGMVDPGPDLRQIFGLEPGRIPALDLGYLLSLAALPYVLGGSALWIGIGFLLNTTIIQGAAMARPITRLEQPELYNLLENLCISRGMRMPKLYVIDTPALNAFASGLSDDSYAITLTSGLIEKLNRDEIEAVLGHELTHIMNRDVRLVVLTVLFTGMLAFAGEILLRMFSHNTSYRSRSRERGSGVVPFLLLAIVILLIGRLLATLLRLALSRRREYMADAGSVELTKRPDAMISALEKISGKADMPFVPSGVRAMMIENPPGLLSLFDTHPPIAARIAVLRRIGNLPEKGESLIPSVG
ncbi:MAG: protease [Proteobacteria bacterium]|nr:protease [Pseudomonadota bacterium]